MRGFTQAGAKFPAGPGGLRWNMGGEIANMAGQNRLKIYET